MISLPTLHIILSKWQPQFSDIHHRSFTLYEPLTNRYIVHYSIRPYYCMECLPLNVEKKSIYHSNDLKFRGCQSIQYELHHRQLKWIIIDSGSLADNRK